MFVLLLLHLALGALLIAIGERLGRQAFAVAAVAPAATLGWAATHAGDVVDGVAVDETVGWIGGLDLTLDLRLDGFGLVMLLLVSGIGLLVCVYSLGYFAHIKRGQARLAGLMTLFAGSMLGVVLADHLIALFVAWELTTITSYLLIGNDDRNPAARAAALQAMFVTGGGGLALLVGLVMLGTEAGTYRIGELLVDPPTGGTTGVALVCILVGAFTKSAQAPFSSWLPGAMVAPTPISTYLHSATMVKAGVYLVARLAPVLATIGPWRVLVLVVGAATMVVGGLRALRQHDLKLLLAYGTVSQLGFMMLLVGTGEYKIAQAGVVLLLAHGAFKATLFMLVGVIDHEVGTRDIRRLHGFGAGWWPVQAMAFVGAASMAGLPPLVGFVAKEKALDTYLESGEFTGAGVVLAVIVVGSILTFAYSARFVLGVLGRFGDDDEPDRSHGAHRAAPVFVAPAAVLTLVTVVLGLAPGLIDPLVGAATVALDPAATPSTVKLWSGFNTAFVLSLVVIGGGASLALARTKVATAQAAAHRVVARLPSSEDGYVATLRAVDATASRVTRTVQTGSLPVYLLVILATAGIVPVLAVLGDVDLSGTWVEQTIHLPLVAVIIGCAIAAAVTTRRIAAVILLSAVGFAMAGLYEAQGAPDLALTQFAIETLGTVLFVLVLRFLPARFVDLAPAVVRPLRLAVSVVVAGAVFVFALTASNSRDDVAAESVSVEMVARSKEDGGGRNVVNVILVDFRGWDTMGEITVLVVAAVGAVAIAQSGRRRRADPVLGAAGGRVAPSGRHDRIHPHADETTERST